jgi:hypothetical protein
MVVPPTLNYGYVMGECINEFKRSLKKIIFPITSSSNISSNSSFNPDPNNVSMITLANVTYNETDHKIAIDGYVDGIAGTDIHKFNKTIADSIIPITTIPPFGAIQNFTSDISPNSTEVPISPSPGPKKL